MSKHTKALSFRCVSSTVAHMDFDQVTCGYQILVTVMSPKVLVRMVWLD